MKMFGVDKVAHFGISGMLYLMFYAFFHSVPIAFSMTIAVGVFREITGWKYDSWYDMLCNLVGMFCSMALIAIMLR